MKIFKWLGIGLAATMALVVGTAALGSYSDELAEVEGQVCNIALSGRL